MARKITIEENVLDKAIKWVAPVRAARRFHARAMLALAGGYVGGSRTRRSLSTFTPHGTSADAALLPDLPDLRARSRDLYRNSPLAGGAIKTNVTSVAGDGLTMKCAIDREYLGLSDEAAEQWEKDCERLWCLWSESKECDTTRTQPFGEMQGLVLGSTLKNGDVFSVLPMITRPGSPFDLKVTLIEADRVTNKNFQRDTDTMAGGVELDENAAPKNYHILRAHPGGITGQGQREWDVVPAFGEKSGRRNVLHHFDRLDVGQNRGVPYLAPVIETLKLLTDYTENELTASVVSSMFTVFIKNEDGDANLGPMAPTSETGGSASDEDYKLGNGAMIGLAPGESIETANPGRPNEKFDPFVLAITRQIGVRLELPYEVLIKHFTASYSAARAALLEAWRFFRVRRAWLVNSFCQPVYEAFVDECVAKGFLAAPGYFADPLVRHAYCRAIWVGRPMGHIQPQQEAAAMETRVSLGVTNREREALEYDGSDWEQTHRQSVREKKMRMEDGLDQPPPVPGADPNNPAKPGKKETPPSDKPEEY